MGTIVKLLLIGIILTSTSLTLAYFVRARAINEVRVHEEILYDSFGVVERIGEGRVKLDPYEGFKIIRVNVTGKIDPICEMVLVSNVPEAFLEEIVIKESNVPINSNFRIEPSEFVDLELEIRLKDNSFEREIGDFNYPDEAKAFLGREGLIFDYPIKDPDVQKLVESIDPNLDVLEVVKEIKELTKKLMLKAPSLDEEASDCDDHAKLFVTISRATGIPSRVAFNSNHMWAEVLMPFKDGSHEWIVIDPTDSNQISYPLSVDLKPNCDGFVIEDEAWEFI